MNALLTSNEWQWRLARTIAWGVLGVVVPNIDVLMGALVLGPAAREICVALCTTVDILQDLGTTFIKIGQITPMYADMIPREH